MDTHQKEYNFYKKYPFNHVVWARYGDHECVSHYGQYLPEHWDKLNQIARNQIIVTSVKIFESDMPKDGFADRMVFILSTKKRSWIMGNANRPKVAFFTNIEDMIAYRNKAFPYVNMFVVGGLSIFNATWSKTGCVYLTEVEDIESKIQNTVSYPYIPLCAVMQKDEEFQYEAQRRGGKQMFLLTKPDGYRTKHSVLYRDIE